MVFYDVPMVIAHRNHGNASANHRLLVAEALVASEQNVEPGLLGGGQESAVGKGRPAYFLGELHVEYLAKASQSTRDIMVEENALQRVVANAAAWAWYQVTITFTWSNGIR